MLSLLDLKLFFLPTDMILSDLSYRRPCPEYYSGVYSKIGYFQRLALHQLIEFIEKDSIKVGIDENDENDAE